MTETIALIKIPPLQSLGVFLFIISASYLWGSLFCRRSSIFVKIPAGMIVLAFLQNLLLPFAAVRYFSVVPAIIFIFALFGLFLLWKNENRQKLLVWSGVFLLFCAPAFLPPHGWDEQVYQTPFLINIAQSGTPGSIAANPYAAYGLLDHYLIAGSANYGGTALLRLLSQFCVIYLAALVYSQLEKRSKITALCAGLFFTGNLSIHFAHIYFAESFVAMLFGAGYVALNEAKSPFWRRALLAGVFSGSAIAVKLTGFAPALTLFILLWQEKRPNLREYLRDTAIFALASGVVVFSFYLRNYLECGDFFYPFVNGFFNSDQTTVEISRRMTALGSERYGAGPLYGTIFGWFFAGFYREIYDGFILGWTWLFFLLTMLFFAIKAVKERRYSRREMVIFSGFLAGYLFWALSSQQSRFLYYLFAPAAIATGIFLTPSGKVTTVLRTIGALFFAIYALLTIKYLYVAIRYLPEARKDPAHFALTVAKDKAYMASVDALNKISAKYPDRPLARLYESRNLYLAAPSVDITPGFNRLLTPLPENERDFYEKICNYSAIIYVPAYRQMDHALADLETRKSLEKLLLKCLGNRWLKIQQVPGSDDFIFLPAEPKLSGGAESEESSFSN